MYLFYTVQLADNNMGATHAFSHKAICDQSYIGPDSL